MYAKNIRPSAKREVQIEQSAKPRKSLITTLQLFIEKYIRQMTTYMKGLKL